MEKILVAEDNQDLMVLITKKLELSGFSVIAATDGQQALARLKEMPDLLLLDIGMPVMNGLQVLVEKDKDPEIRNIPTIIISNSGDQFDLRTAKRLGVEDCLVKVDFDPDELVEKTNSILKKIAAAGKVLVVEDEMLLRTLLIKKLKNCGFNVYEANAGESGVAMAQKIKPDLVLLDLMLPGLNGFDVLKAIQETCDPAPAVMIISNLSEKVEMDKALALGAVEYFVKAHIDLDDLANKVIAWTQKNKKAV